MYSSHFGRRQAEQQQQHTKHDSRMYIRKKVFDVHVDLQMIPCDEFTSPSRKGGPMMKGDDDGTSTNDRKTTNTTATTRDDSFAPTEKCPAEESNEGSMQHNIQK